MPPSELRALGVYGGAQGIWVDKERTARLSPDGQGITVAILHTGRYYPDDLSEEGVIYHYPRTGRGGKRDQNEIDATKNAKTLEVPLFVVLPGVKNKARRHVKLGWVEDWDDEGRLFLISFSDRPTPVPPNPPPEAPFQLEDKVVHGTARTKTRPNQQRFRFRVLQQYGHKCAVCSITLPQLLVAAHIRGKEDHGSDDWRNGIPLCGTHHAAFDLHMFGIDPETFGIAIAEGIKPDDIGIECKRLATLHNQPHREALAWKWDQVKKAWGG
jgi:hypothetical protein